MKARFAAAGCLLAALLTGCSQPETQDIPDPAIQEETVQPVSGTVYYVTDHKTTALPEVSSFTAELTALGYTFEVDALAAIPLDADAVIFNTPREDITSEELEYLGSYMDEGGHLMLLMPPDEREMRYKNLELLLEDYLILMDYDILSETDKTHMAGEDPYFLQIEPISTPNGMDFPENAETAPAWQHNVRSFHFIFGDSAVKQDAMLETLATAVGTPYGGTEDDPLTYEGEQLITMLYSRNDERGNSTIIAIGSSDFLLDENYAADTSLQMKQWVIGSLQWFTGFLH